MMEKVVTLSESKQTLLFSMLAVVNGILKRGEFVMLASIFKNGF